VSFVARRRGALVALAVGVTVLVLYVVLQPGDRPQRVESAGTTTVVAETTTTRPPLDELCDLARDFETASQGQDATVTARLGEAFYTRASELAPPDVRPEYEAAARYYTEFNNIGEPYEYDFWAILGSSDGPRWMHLLFREPLGVPTARVNVAFICRLEVPPPPTLTTTTTRPRATTTAPVDGAPVDGATTVPGATSAPATAAPTATPPPATAAPG
jgi:hypothetical protein